MLLIKHLTTWLLLLTVITASGIVSAKVASGSQNLSGSLHQAETGFNSLIRQAKIDFSYDAASGFPLATKSADKWSRAPKSIQDQMTLDAARKGAGSKIRSNLGDPKFKGMEKWEYKSYEAMGSSSFHNILTTCFIIQDDPIL